MRAPIEKKTLLGFAFALIAAVAIGFGLHWSIRELRASQEAVTRAQETVQDLRALEASLADLAAYERSYLITGQESFLAPYTRAGSEISSLLDRVALIGEQDSIYQDRVAKLREMIEAAITESKVLWVARGEGGFAAVESMVVDKGGTLATEEARRRVQGLERAQQQDLFARKADQGRRDRIFLLTAVGGGGLQLLILLVIFWFVVLGIREKRQVETELRETEEFKERVLETSGDCIQVLSLDARLLSMNSEGRKRMGVKRFAAIANVSWPELWRDDAVELAIEAVAEARAGRNGRFQGLCPTMAGTPKWWDVLITPVMGVGGQPEKLLAVLRDVTESRAAQDKFRILFEHSANAHLLLDEGGVIDCNPACLELLRARNKTMLVGRRMAELSPAVQPDGALSEQKLEELHQLALNSGSFRHEWQVRRTDGEEVTVEVSLTPVQLNGKQVLLAVWHDLTERKRTEAALRESEERFQAFMNHSPAVAYIKDDEGRFVYINKVFADRFSVSMEELVGKTDFDWLPEESARVVVENDRQVIASNQMARVMEVVPTADGRRVEWLVLKFPMSTTSGRKLLGGVGIDITKQKQAERALQESEARFRDLFDDAPVAYHELDTDNRLTRVNKTELAMLGYTAEEMVGRPVWDFIVEDPSDDAIPVQLGGGSAAGGNATHIPAQGWHSDPCAHASQTDHRLR